MCDKDIYAIIYVYKQLNEEKNDMIMIINRLAICNAIVLKLIDLMSTASF